MKRIIIILILISNSVFADKIHELVLKGDLKGIKKILNVNPGKINSVDDSKFPFGSPLHFAAYNNKIEIVKYLISMNDNVNKVNFLKVEPIFYSFKNNNIFIVKLLTINGANLNGILLDINKKTPVEIVKFLVENGADINVVQGETSQTPLNSAIDSNNVEVAAYLKSLGAVDSVDFFSSITERNLNEVKRYLKRAPGLINTEWMGSKSVLHIAAERGFINIVRYFLNIGFNPNAITKKLESSLHLASSSGEIEVVKLLLRAGAKILKDEDGFTPLTYSIGVITKEKTLGGAYYYPGYVSKKKYLEIAKILIKQGADINSRDKEGKTDLYYAIVSGDYEIEMVKLLLKNGASTKNIDGKGHSALDIAKKEKNTNLINIFKEKK